MDARVVLALAAILGGATIAAVGAMPQAHLTPAQYVADAQPGDTVTLKGVIILASANGTGPFTVGDGEHNVTVHWDHPYPANFAAGRTTAVHGTVNPDGTLDAERIEVGCPSTYDATANP